jgi:hypothetical protein
MEIMGTAPSMITEGIVRENPQTVKNGVDLIINHPAPNHKPWLIVAPADQKEFKETLVSYEKILDSHAGQVSIEVEKRDWSAANNVASTLLSSCIAFHASWKDKTIDIRLSPPC